MSSPQTPREPTMEEILASIRRIIAEEGQGQPPAKGTAAGAATPPLTASVPIRAEQGRIAPADPAANSPAGSVLDLTDFIEDDAPREGEAVAPLAPHEPDTAAAFEPVPSDAKPDDLDSAPAPLALPAAEPKEEGSVLLTLESEAVLARALDEVAEKVRAEKPAESAKPGSSPLEALVLEALRPSLQTWLDQNLPELVERVLREELRRLARRVEDA